MSVICHRNCKYFHSLSFIFWFCLWRFWSIENWGLSHWLYWFFFIKDFGFCDVGRKAFPIPKYILVLPWLFPLHLWSDQIIGLRQVSVVLGMILLRWLIMAHILQRPFSCSDWGRKEFLHVSHGTQPPTLYWTSFKARSVQW